MVYWEKGTGLCLGTLQYWSFPECLQDGKGLGGLAQECLIHLQPLALVVSEQTLLCLES